MDNCLFCKIVRGEIPSARVYEDERVFAFLDITNDPEGHTLVVLKNHSVNLYDTNPSDFAYLAGVAQKIANHYVDISYADGINLYINSGKCAGQEVDHLHIHILPRKHGDEVKIDRAKNPSSNSLASISEKLKLN